LKQPEVYIGKVENVPWKTDVSLDDDHELESTPQDVVAILGFDPNDEGD